MVIGLAVRPIKSTVRSACPAGYKVSVEWIWHNPSNYDNYIYMHVTLFDMVMCPEDLKYQSASKVVWYHSWHINIFLTSFKLTTHLQHHKMKEFIWFSQKFAGLTCFNSFSPDESKYFLCVNYSHGKKAKG